MKLAMSEQEFRKQHVIDQLNKLGIFKIDGKALGLHNYRTLLFILAKERAKGN